MSFKSPWKSMLIGRFLFSENNVPLPDARSQYQPHQRLGLGGCVVACLTHLLTQMVLTSSPLIPKYRSIPSSNGLISALGV
jgi:hypothetical protein